MLLPEDEAYLQRQQYSYSVAAESGYTCVVIRGYPLPAGYQVAHTDLLLRLPGGFPDAAPDMWWCNPEARLASGQYPPNTNVIEAYLGQTWQRWSRHYPPGQWRPGRSGLESFLATIRKDFEKWVVV